jgi:hypothetical protein
MANISTYLEEALLGHVMKNSSYTSPAVVYCGLVTSSASASDMEAGTLTNEITSYTGNRKAITFGTISQAGGKSLVKNSAAIEFEDMPAATVAYAIICDASTVGNILWWCPLDTNKNTNAGDTFRIPIDGLTVDLD